MEKKKSTKRILSLVLAMALLMTCVTALNHEKKKVLAEAESAVQTASQNGETHESSAPGTSENRSQSEEQNGSETESAKGKSDETLAPESGEETEGSVDKRETAYVMMDADGNVEEVIVSEQLSNTQQEDEITDYSDLENIESTSGNVNFVQDGPRLKWQAKGQRVDYRGNYHGELPLKVKISYFLDGEKKSAAEMAGQAGEVKIRFDYEILQKDLVDGEFRLHPYTLLSGLSLDNKHFSEIEVSSGKILDDGTQTLVFGVAFPGIRENLELETKDSELPSFVEVRAKTDAFSLSSTYSMAFSGLLSEFNTDKATLLQDKISELKLALTGLSGSSKLLLKNLDRASSGASQLDKGLEGLHKGLKKFQTGSESLEAGAEELQQGLAALSAKSAELNQGISSIEASIFASASQQLSQVLGQSISLTPENYAQILEGLSGQMVQAPPESAEAGLKQIAQLKNQLDGVEALVYGISSYTNGVDAAAAGSEKCLEGASALKNGASELKKGSAELLKGSQKLNGGLEKLKDGMKRFDKDGLDRLLSAFRDADVEKLLKNIQGVSEASQKSYLLGGKTDAMSGASKLIFKTGAISIDNSDNKD